MMAASRESASHMPRLQAKSFENPDDVRTMPLTRVETVSLDETQVGHCAFEPGWRWSESIAPLIGVDSCPFRHLGYTISGAIHVEMDDGAALDIGPNEVFDIPPGHDKWVVGDEAWVTIEWGGSGRAMGEALKEAPGRSLATVMFTDIVDSTRHVRELGDAAWRDLLAAHNARMREQVNVFRGREVKSTGDGLLVLFEAPARAVRCALAMVDANHSMGIEIRAGIHTGEVELAGDDVRGIAVHMAARVAAMAGASEILVTTTTRDLVEGSGIALEDTGEHALRGIDTPRRLFRVGTAVRDGDH
jgi:class 3 adenylate cyclase